jgi:hypothetical protein
MGSMGKKLFSKINLKPLSPMKSLQTFYIQGTRKIYAPILGKFDSCPET